jgi:ATP-dependent helicase/nuclease subunit A
MTPLERANAEQRAASNPKISAFVAASAGSGKTKLLTDRLLRLMLSGTRPDRILCLTYTKAAAAEMTIRLNRRLGEWVAMPERELDAQLQLLDIDANAKTRRQARMLFGDVLDLPGGMRIETIHAFCQSLLRRFPLEAGVSPHFKLEEEAAAAMRLREAREYILSAPEHREAITALAGETDERSFTDLITKLNAGEDALHELLRTHEAADISGMQYDALNALSRSHEDILRKAMQWPRETHLRTVLSRIASGGTNTGKTWALDRLAWLDADIENRLATWDDWVKSHFTVKGERRKMKTYTGVALAAEADLLHAEIDLEHDRIENLQDAVKAAQLLMLNSHLLNVAAPILQYDSSAKSEQAQVTYGDLISMTGELLKDPGAAWILYKLDGGIEHLLLDEVQDTAPEQWKIANAIAEEFFAGQGATDQPRSIFAVGDAKQSIFSFQGADLHSFETNRASFRSRVKDAGQRWLDGELSVSFRSTAPILKLVDAVFSAGPAQAGVVAPGATLSHGVSRSGQAGSVAIWPLTEPSAAPDPPAWEVPDDYASEDSAKTVLAREIALHIRKLLDEPHVFQSRGRVISPGDVLILIRRRDEMVSAITRELKKIGVPVAGADRMVLTEQQAVSDLLALCDALLLPQDDLAFAQFLASPLGDLGDESLMQLAIARRGSLYGALAARHGERKDWDAAHGFFSALRAQADFVPPYALLMEALGPLGGRARLLARLGPEAAEPIDELLAEALAFVSREAVSLQNFVFSLRQSGAEIKREAESGGDVVRIMTVHGAKGLQAPLVILPDTAGMPKFDENLFWLTPPQPAAPQSDTKVPIYCPRKELRPKAVSEAIAQEKAAKLEEYNRLLYVALTRAEDELIVCGAKPKNTVSELCWYESVRRGFERLEVPPDADGKRVSANSQTAEPDRRSALATVAPVSPIPGWTGGAPFWRATPPPVETTRPEPLAPSRNTEDDAKRAVTASPLGDTLARFRQARAAALAKGRMVHALLQHLPEIPAARRGQAADRYLAYAAGELAPNDRAAIGRSVMEILEDRRLLPLFAAGSRAEAPITGVVGDMEIGGLIDRLAIGETEILVADYKTDRQPPASADAIPPAYLRQLAAYAALLAQIYPSHSITCVLIWTESAIPMLVPRDLLAGHAPAPAQPYGEPNMA